MQDKDVIQAAYEDQIKKVFSIFSDAYAIAQNPGEEQQAEQRFRTAVTKARDARTRAQNILP
jgi:hypothetical protein